MIESNFIIVSIISIVVWIIYRIILEIKDKKVNLFREIILFIFFVYFLYLLLLTIFKGGIITIRNLSNEYMYRQYGLFGVINFVPIKGTVETFMHSEAGKMNSIRNIIGNIIAFMPLGFFIPLLFDKFNNYKKVIKVGFLSSLAIEITQLFVGSNVCDIDDIIYNTLGAIAGFLCFKVFEMIIIKIKIKEKIDRIRDFQTKNILKKSFKGISIVCAVVVMSYIYAFYNQTMSGELSNEELAKTTFNCDSKDILQIKEFNDSKFYLIKSEFGIEVKQINKFIMNRYIDSYMAYSFVENDKYGYRQDWIYSESNNDSNDNKMSTIIYGKNNDAEKVIINIKGKTFEQKINKDDYFMVIYPELVSFNEAEINEIYDDSSRMNIVSVKFLDVNGKEINTLKDLNLIEG